MKDRYFFIKENFVTIYNELISDIERFDFNLDNMECKKGIINTNEKLKNLFSDKEKENFYIKIKTKEYYNYIFIDKNRIIKDKYYSFEDLTNQYIVDVKEFIKDITISTVKKISNREYIHNIKHLNNFHKLQYFDHNGILYDNRKYIIFQ